MRSSKTSPAIAVLCFLLTGTVAAQARESFDLVCPMSGQLSDGRPAATFTRVYSVDFTRSKVCTRTKGVCDKPSTFSVAGNRLELFALSRSLVVEFGAEFDLATNLLTEKTAINGKEMSIETGHCKRRLFTPLTAIRK